MLLNVIILLTGVVFCVVCIFPEFDDQHHYSIVWNDVLSGQSEVKNTLETILVTTNKNEQYQCLLPVVQGTNEIVIDDSNGPSPEVLLADLFLGNLQHCSFRLEPYWTYELCHGQQILQFHEEKDRDGILRKTEFILGKLTKAEVREILSPTEPITTEKSMKVPTRNIDNKETPYYSIEMGNGTPCDLNDGKPRKTNVLYICHPGANNEVMSIKEITTCEYEAIVLTPNLCTNPAYITKIKEVHNIQCHAMPGSPRLPKMLSEYSQRQSRPAANLEEKDKNAPKDDGRTHFKPTDKTINVKFLKGEYCLHGGSGWWQYEFCNGKHIIQYHLESNGQKTVIVVGRWDKQKHLDHIKTNNLKAKAKNHVSHYYFGGDVCDLTGKHRIAHIMLICKEVDGQSLSIYMTEDKPCVYTVGVESPILCPYVNGANEDGIYVG